MNINVLLNNIMNNQVKIFNKLEQLEVKMDAMLGYAPDDRTNKVSTSQDLGDKTDIFQEKPKRGQLETYTLEDIFNEKGKLKSKILEPLCISVFSPEGQLRLLKFVNDLILHMLMMPKGSRLNIKDDFIPGWQHLNQTIEDPSIGFSYMKPVEMQVFTSTCERLNHFNDIDMLNLSYSIPEAPGSCVRNLIYVLQYKNISPALTVFKLLVTNPYFYQTRFV